MRELPGRPASVRSWIGVKPSSAQLTVEKGKKMKVDQSKTSNSRNSDKTPQNAIKSLQKLSHDETVVRIVSEKKGQTLLVTTKKIHSGK